MPQSVGVKFAIYECYSVTDKPQVLQGTLVQGWPKDKPLVLQLKFRQSL